MPRNRAIQPPCATGCGRTANCKGLCQACYQRQRRAALSCTAGPEHAWVKKGGLTYCRHCERRGVVGYDGRVLPASRLVDPETARFTEVCDRVHYLSQELAAICALLQEIRAGQPARAPNRPAV